MTDISEKRRESRRQASGVIRIRFENPDVVNLEGGLVDVSPGGFRMSHACALLETGAVVEFWHGSASGQAKVMWNRVLGPVIESGFLVIE